MTSYAIYKVLANITTIVGPNVTVVVHTSYLHTFAKDLISGSLSCIRPAVSTRTTSHLSSRAKTKTNVVSGNPMEYFLGVVHNATTQTRYKLLIL